MGVVLRLSWTWYCSWGPWFYSCGSSDQDGLNYPHLCWSSLASVAWYGKGEPDHLQSPGHQIWTKESAEFLFLYGLWISSTASWWSVAMGRVTAGTLVWNLSQLNWMLLSCVYSVDQICLVANINKCYAKLKKANNNKQSEKNVNLLSGRERKREKERERERDDVIDIVYIFLSYWYCQSFFSYTDSFILLLLWFLQPLFSSAPMKWPKLCTIDQPTTHGHQLVIC